MLIIESECSMLLLIIAVAGFIGFGMGRREGGVNVISVVYVFYVYFLIYVFFCCMHAALRRSQLSQVPYLLSLVLKWGKSIIIFDSLPQNYPVT